MHLITALKYINEVLIELCEETENSKNKTRRYENISS